MGLLDPGFEEVGRLEESGGQAAGCQTGEEVERLRRVLAFGESGRGKMKLVINECT